MVFAKTSKAASRLSEQVRNKDFHKKYLAIVDGKMENEKDHFEDYLYKNEKTNTSRITDPKEKNAKFASLDYEVIKYNEEINMSVVKIDLHTGRHHQIRVQFASRGHSVSGDQKYGTRGRGKQLALFAYYLSFNHPTTKEKLEFEIEPKHERKLENIRIKKKNAPKSKSSRSERGRLIHIRAVKQVCHK